MTEAQKPSILGSCGVVPVVRGGARSSDSLLVEHESHGVSESVVLPCQGEGEEGLVGGPHADTLPFSSSSPTLLSLLESRVYYSTSRQPNSRSPLLHQWTFASKTSTFPRQPPRNDSFHSFYAMYLLLGFWHWATLLQVSLSRALLRRR